MSLLRIKEYGNNLILHISKMQNKLISSNFPMQILKIPSFVHHLKALRAVKVCQDHVNFLVRQLYETQSACCQYRTHTELMLHRNEENEERISMKM